jgi:hypothetical protein
MMIKESKLWFGVFILMCWTMILFPIGAHANPYLYQKVITIDHTKVSATLTNFPVLVSIVNDNDLKNHVTNANGYDIVFKDTNNNNMMNSAG